MQRGAGQVAQGGQSLRGVVVELAAAAGQTVVDGELRGELGQTGHVAVGDDVDGSRGAGDDGGFGGGGCHEASLWHACDMVGPAGWCGAGPVGGVDPARAGMICWLVRGRARG